MNILSAFAKGSKCTPFFILYFEIDKVNNLIHSLKMWAAKETKVTFYCNQIQQQMKPQLHFQIKSISIYKYFNDFLTWLEAYFHCG